MLQINDLKALFSDLGSIRKDQTLPLLLEYEKGAKESFWDQFVAPPPLPLVAPLQHVVHINNLSVYYTEGTLNTNMYVIERTKCRGCVNSIRNPF